MKTAVIIAGVCRHCKISAPSWNLPFSADYFLATWNVSQSAYSPDLIPNTELEHLKHINFKQIFLEDYIHYHTNHRGHHAGRTFYLYNLVYRSIKNQGYERVILFRPDLYLHPIKIDANDFNVKENSGLILGMHEPEHWVDHNSKEMEDEFFCFDWIAFEKFANFWPSILQRGRNIHYILYDFIHNSGINLDLLKNYRSVIIRQSAEEYVNQGNEITYDMLLSKFMETYKSKNHLGKFVKNFNYENINISSITRRTR